MAPRRASGAVRGREETTSPPCLSIRPFVLRKTTSLEISCNLYPQIAEYMRAFREVPELLLSTFFNTHSASSNMSTNSQTNAIFMYRLLCLFVPWSSPLKTLAGKKNKNIKNPTSLPFFPQQLRQSL